MTVIIAASLLMVPVPSSELAVGRAVYYSAAYDRGGWEQIVRMRQGWGQLPADFAMPDGAFYCAHPDHAIGTVLHVQNVMTGTAIRCVVVDRVAPLDAPHWRDVAVIELSYAGFCAVDGRQVNRVVVTR
jgi:hypothetical protein